jgi:hypothetical protein
VRRAVPVFPAKDPLMMLRLLSERAVVALCLLMVAVALAVSTLGLEFAELGGAFDPTFFPQIVLTGWIALAVLNAAVDLRSGQPWNLEGTGRAVVMAALVLVYVMVLKSYGFFACSVVLSVIFLLLLGVRSVVPIVAVSIGVPGTLVALFNHILIMPLPTSPLFWWI